MKKVTIILTGVILMTIAALNVNAQSQTATAGATASATIVKPITILNSTPLAFGLLSPTSLAGTVTLTPASTTLRSAENVTLLGTLPVTSAAYAITGETGALYGISIPATISLTGAGDPMVITTTQSKTATGNVMVAGDNPLYVGGTLAVAANQAAGAYSATYNVTVTYE